MTKPPVGGSKHRELKINKKYIYLKAEFQFFLFGRDRQSTKRKKKYIYSKRLRIGVVTYTKGEKIFANLYC